MTDEDYKLLQDKYGNLIYYTALRISGDKSQSPEDYVNAIWAHILHYLPKYMQQEKVETVQEFIEKYNPWVKQWIFTVKNQIGSEITKESNVHQASSLTCVEDTDFDIEDKSQSDLVDYEDNPIDNRLPKNKVGEVAKVLMHCDEVYTLGGKINFSELKRRTKMSVPMLKSIIEELKSDIHKYIEQ